MHRFFFFFLFRSPQSDAEDAVATVFPIARIKRIAKMDEDVKLLSPGAALLIAKATELFVEQLTAAAFAQTAKTGRKTLAYNDCAQAVLESDCYEFLADVMPLQAPKKRKAGGGGGAGASKLAKTNDDTQPQLDESAPSGE